MSCKTSDIINEINIINEKYGAKVKVDTAFNNQIIDSVVAAGSAYSKDKESYNIPANLFSQTNEEKKHPTVLDTIKRKMKLISDTIKKRNNIHSKTKEYEKSKIANKFIGHGTVNSSTGFYEKLYTKHGMANNEEYTSDDVVFVSINGKRKGAIAVVDKNGKLNNVYKLIDKAIRAGATIIMDTDSHAKSYFNKEGEGRLLKYMQSIAKEKGYIFTNVTDPKWTHKVKGKTVRYGYGKWEKKTESNELNKILNFADKKHKVKPEPKQKVKAKFKNEFKVNEKINKTTAKGEVFEYEVVEILDDSKIKIKNTSTDKVLKNKYNPELFSKQIETKANITDLNKESQDALDEVNKLKEGC